MYELRVSLGSGVLTIWCPKPSGYADTRNYEYLETRIPEYTDTRNPKYRLPKYPKARKNLKKLEPF